MTESPIPASVGLSAKRDRIWGVIGGVLGVLVGGGSAAVAVFGEGADLLSAGPYPPFFATRRLLMYDVFLALVITVGVAFAVAGIVLARRSPFPRTDAFGALLVSAVLTALGGALVFARLIAVIRGPLVGQ
jgi:hypothetical protein